MPIIGFTEDGCKLVHFKITAGSILRGGVLPFLELQLPERRKLRCQFKMLQQSHS